MLQDIKIFGFSELKEIHRERRANFKEEFSLRIHRGLSWVQRAEKELEDPDASFIFYWIAFNSIYADIDAKEAPEKSKFNNFFNQILKLDDGKKVYSLLWIRFHNEIKSLLNNQFIFQPFWWHMIDKSAPNWEDSFNKANKRVEYAFLDATFYKNGELKRDMSEIPHPFVEESMDLFSTLKNSDKKKVYFIHLNHTNPLLIDGSTAQKEVINKGFNIAKEGSIISF